MCHEFPPYTIKGIGYFKHYKLALPLLFRVNIEKANPKKNYNILRSTRPYICPMVSKYEDVLALDSSYTPNEVVL